jgi:hypothetical protein
MDGWISFRRRFQYHSIIPIIKCGIMLPRHRTCQQYVREYIHCCCYIVGHFKVYVHMYICTLYTSCIIIIMRIASLFAIATLLSFGERLPQGVLLCMQLSCSDESSVRKRARFLEVVASHKLARGHSKSNATCSGFASPPAQGTFRVLAEQQIVIVSEVITSAMFFDI